MSYEVPGILSMTSIKEHYGVIIISGLGEFEARQTFNKGEGTERGVGSTGEKKLGEDGEREK